MKNTFLALAFSTLLAPAAFAADIQCGVYETVALADAVTCDQYCTEERGPFYVTGGSLYDSGSLDLSYGGNYLSYQVKIVSTNLFSLKMVYNQDRKSAEVSVGGTFDLAKGIEASLTVNGSDFQAGDITKIRLSCTSN